MDVQLVSGYVDREMADGLKAGKSAAGAWIMDGAAGWPGYLNRLLGETSTYDPLLLQ